jgi:GNAT superfamily N-acetyltransferase
VTARAAAADDAAAIARLLTELGYPHSADEARSRLEAWIGGERRLLLVATEDDAPIGLVAVAALPYLERAGSWARIVALAVAASHRRRGVGRTLVAAAEEAAVRWGCVTIEATSARRRLESHPFYLGLGYEDRCRRSALYRRELSAREPG